MVHVWLILPSVLHHRVLQGRTGTLPVSKDWEDLMTCVAIELHHRTSHHRSMQPSLLGNFSCDLLPCQWKNCPLSSQKRNVLHLTLSVLPPLTSRECLFHRHVPPRCSPSLPIYYIMVWSLQTRHIKMSFLKRDNFP